MAIGLSIYIIGIIVVIAVTCFLDGMAKPKIRTKPDDYEIIMMVSLLWPMFLPILLIMWIIEKFGKFCTHLGEKYNNGR